MLALLGQRLDPALVSERETRNGRLVQYTEGWAIINQANRTFGFDGWGAEVVGEVAYRPLSLADPDTGESVAAGMYTAMVRVVVRGCPPKADVGCAFVSQDTPEAHEAAYKGAVTHRHSLRGGNSPLNPYADRCRSSTWVFFGVLRGSDCHREV